MEQARQVIDELERRRLQEYIFNLEEMQDRAEDLIIEHKELEARVEDRTSELRKVSEQLQEELSERKRAETEKRDLESQFLQSQKLDAVGKLGGGIAHDFNNILTAIQGNISLMLLDSDPSDLHWRQLKNIENLIERGSRLTSQLLAYVRKGKREVRPISLNRLVEETSDAFSRTKKQIVLHKELCRDLCSIKADLGQIEQVLVNLYVNAADAMPGGGDLFLETTNIAYEEVIGKGHCPEPGKYVLLKVRDNGVGMDKETQERIFEPFFTTKKRGKGTGLGLSSAFGVIQDHGGYIFVDSDKGQGTTFEVYFPASKEKVKDRSESIETFVGGTETVLIVDDEESNLDVTLRLLRALGYQVLTAGSGEKALATYERLMGSIDLVILDIVMPGMGGGQVYELLRMIDPNVRVLFISGFESAFEEVGLPEEDRKRFIQKPFRIGKLCQKVREIIDKEEGEV